MVKRVLAAVIVVFAIQVQCVQAQDVVELDLKTTAKTAFSDASKRDADERMRALNLVSPVKIRFNMSLFLLDNISIQLKAQFKVDQAKKNRTLRGTIDDNLYRVSVDISEKKMDSLKAVTDPKAQVLLDGMSDKDNTLLINFTMAYRVIGSADDPFAASYSRITCLGGKNVPAALKQAITAYFVKDINNRPNYHLDKKNNISQYPDDFLRDFVNFLYTKAAPATISYADTGARNLDDNAPAKTKGYPSFKTQPIEGMPWKCIPADGTFVPLKVTIKKAAGSNAVVTFTVKDNANFTLRSPAPDASSQLWISSSAANKETIVTPVIDNNPVDAMGISVVSYEKIVKDVVVVRIDEENDDEQVVPFGSMAATVRTPIIVSGPNQFLDTYQVGGDDRIVTDPATGLKAVFPGPNLKCETKALNTNKPATVGIDLAVLQQQLDQFYNPVMVQWRVHQTDYRKAVNYDLDHDGLLDIGYFSTDTVTGKNVFIPTDEEGAINANAKIVPGTTHYIFLIDDYERAADLVLGRQTGDMRSALIFATVAKIVAGKKNLLPVLKDYIISIVAHELGHAGFNLVHVDDEVNLMGWGHSILSKSLFRKFQWDIIHGVVSP